jgi:NADPH:quinone reductase-like Zn-dependent oxidoreductase
MPLQKQIDMETGATLIVNPITAWALIDTAKQHRHKAIANTAAASQLGRMIMKLGQAAGLQVVNIVRRPEQVDLLKGMGAAYVLNSSEPQFQAQMREMFHNLHVTLALDAISGDMTGQLLEALPNHSEVLVYGRLSGRYSHVSAVELMSTDKIVSGFLLTRWFAKQNLLKILRVSNQVQKRLGSDLKTEIQRRVTLDELPAAIAAYEENMTAGKVLLTF